MFDFFLLLTFGNSILMSLYLQKTLWTRIPPEELVFFLLFKMNFTTNCNNDGFHTWSNSCHPLRPYLRKPPHQPAEHPVLKTKKGNTHVHVVSFLKMC